MKDTPLFKQFEKRHQTWGEVDSALPPDNRCFDWETDSQECDDQWNKWESFCDYDWIDYCDVVHDRWYSQDLDWKTPTIKDESCLLNATSVTQEDNACHEDLYDFIDQCYNEGPYSDEPYMWTDQCEAAEILEWVWFEWYSADQVVMKKSKGGSKWTNTPKKVTRPVKDIDGGAFMSKFLTKVMQWDEEDYEYVPATPDRECMTVDSNSEECGEQWGDWLDYCDHDWTDMCEIVDDHWYAQEGIEWSEPEIPKQECAVQPDQMTQECQIAWQTMADQCYDEANTEDPRSFKWTEDCDMLMELIQAVENLGYSTDMDQEVVLQKVHERKLLKQHQFSMSAIALAKQADEEKSFDYSGYVAGASIGLAAAAAAIYAVRQCRKSAIEDDFHRIE